LENPAVLIQTEQADMIKGNNMVIDDPRPEEDAKSTPSRKVVIEKLPDGEETITITIRGSTTGNHERKAKGSNLAHDNGKQKPTAADQEQAVRQPRQARSGDRAVVRPLPELVRPHLEMVRLPVGPVRSPSLRTEPLG
jgi:hypothetical protein